MIDEGLYEIFRALQGKLFENDVFLMHDDCQDCGVENCMWCYGCQCEQSPIEHYLDGVLVDDWSETSSKILAPMPHDVAAHGTSEYEKASEIFYRSADERDRRLVTVYPKVVHTCLPIGLMENREAGISYLPNQTAPNFWHKPSGFKVWWYKHIGRGMETNREISQEEWMVIFWSCRASLMSHQTA